ncbi:MAG: hypothetical protein OEW80_11940, partial [Gemmatimonadota bacterium]|nr:hypothetical protein [Gemmatimonadota bacterium]
PKSDIYALGCVTYEMLAGEPPFMGPTAQAIVARVMTEAPRSLQLQRHTIPTHVEAAVQRALEKLPADRFQSAAEFGTALGDPGYASRITVTRAAQGPGGAASMRPLQGPRAALVVIAVLAALAAWGWLRPIPEVPLLRYELSLPPGEQLGNMRGSRIALSADGTQLIYVGPGQRLWHRPRRSLHAQPLPGTQRALNPAVSPDGSKVAFMADEAPAALRVASLDGAPTVTLADSGIGLDGVTWADDGFLYYDGLTFGGTVGLKRIPGTGGPVEQITVVDTAGGEADHIWPAALPGNRGVLFTVQYRDADDGLAVAVWNAGAKAHRVLLQAVTARYLHPGRLLYLTTDGRLLVAPVDLDRLAITGQAEQVADEVGVKAFFAADLAVSATGTVMFIPGGSADAPAELVSVSRDGRAAPLVADWTGDFRTLALSPNGRSLAVSLIHGTGQQIWIKQLPEGPSAKLTLEGALNYRPAWSPDGRTVVFTSNRPGREELYSQRADGSAPAALLVGGTIERTVSEGFITRDGRWLIYRTVPRDILARRLGGADTTSIPLVATAADEVVPSLSPDGRWLAYVSNESGRLDVYVRPFPETSGARWQVSASGGTYPRWSHSGRELFYLSDQDSMVAATVQPGAAFAVSGRRALFSTFAYLTGIGTWDVSPDDQAFIMIRQRSAISGNLALTVIENLPRELENEGAP